MSSELRLITLATLKTMTSTTNIDHFSHFICHAFSPPMPMRFNSYLNNIGSVANLLSDPEDFGFDSNIGHFGLFLYHPFPLYL